MIKLKILKAAVLGICITALSAGMAFAEEGGGQTSASPGEISAVESRLLEVQKGIDQSLFETHAKEIADKGITITQTAPLEGAVEIGILPYNEENAEYLYGLLGREDVKVVEGQPVDIIATTSVVTEEDPDKATDSITGEEAGDDTAVAKDTTLDDSIMEVQITNVNTGAQGNTAPIAYIAGLALMVGGAGAIALRRKAAVK